MEVRVLDDADAVAAHVAELIAGLVSTRPDAVLGLPSGRTPIPIYERLSRSPVDFDATSVVMLDEYAGLDCSDERSFCHYLRRHVTSPLGIPADRLLLLDGSAPDLDHECARFDDLVCRTRVDLQLLGVGRNGHIAFNEPGSGHDSRTRVVELADTTREDNAAAFGSTELVPTRALTQGIGTILEARRIVLVATGWAKAHAVAATVDGPVTVEVPASALQLHDRATVVVDADAATRLTP